MLDFQPPTRRGAEFCWAERAQYPPNVQKPSPTTYPAMTYIAGRNLFQALALMENTFSGHWIASMPRVGIRRHCRSVECHKIINIGRPRSQKGWHRSEHTLWQLHSKAQSKILGRRWSFATSALLGVLEISGKLGKASKS